VTTAALSLPLPLPVDLGESVVDGGLLIVDICFRITTQSTCLVLSFALMFHVEPSFHTNEKYPCFEKTLVISRVCRVHRAIPGLVSDGF